MKRRDFILTTTGSILSTSTIFGSERRLGKVADLQIWLAELNPKPIWRRLSEIDGSEKTADLLPESDLRVSFFSSHPGNCGQKTHHVLVEDSCWISGRKDLVEELHLRHISSPEMQPFAEFLPKLLRTSHLGNRALITIGNLNATQSSSLWDIPLKRLLA